MEKKFVKIQSSITIKCTSGLQFSDYTDVGQPIPNRKNVKPRWTKGTILIKEGQHWYPSVVASWNSVKALEKAGLLSFGGYSDEADEETTKIAEELEKGLKEIKKTQTKEVQVPRLNNIAEE